MFKQIAGTLLVAVMLVPSSGAQTPAPGKQGTWHAADTPPATATDLSPGGATVDANRVRPAPAPSRLSIASGSGVLPNSEGQVWRQYDIRTYTSTVKGTEHPEQAIIDWILRETGTDVWFSEPLGLLSANKETLSVYHTPEMQRIVTDVVDRFVSGTHEPQVIGLRIVSVSNPNWRTTALQRLRPITVQTPGIDAWLLSKEDAAILLSMLQKRADFQEHSAPSLVYYNGQTQALSQLRPRTYIHAYRPRAGQWAGFEPEVRQVQEGFSLRISPLISQDERTLDAVLKCNIDEVEKLVNVPVDMPGFNGQAQRAQIQVPQVVSWRLQERFRWPVDRVLLLSCGVVASPGPQRPNPLGILTPFFGSTSRTDALLFVEYRGRASQALVGGQTTTLGSAAAGNNSRY